MSDPTNPDPEGTRNPDADGGNGGGKSAYVKPSFRQEQVFETMALACGKISPTQGQCRGNRKTS